MDYRQYQIDMSHASLVELLEIQKQIVSGHLVLDRSQELKLAEYLRRRTQLVMSLNVAYYQ